MLWSYAGLLSFTRGDQYFDFKLTFPYFNILLTDQNMLMQSQIEVLMKSKEQSEAEFETYNNLKESHSCFHHTQNNLQKASLVPPQIKWNAAKFLPKVLRIFFIMSEFI